MESSHPEYLYAFVREGYDDSHHTEYYLDEHIAKNRMVDYAITTRCVSCVYVYRVNYATPEKKMKMVKRIDLAHDDSKRFYKIWLKQDAEGLAKNYILSKPEMMHGCLDYVFFH